ncbi:MAG: hypothetical protein AAFQ16_03790, partial [Pseudomonadota bacterium]
MLKRLIPLLVLSSCAIADEHADLVALFERWRAFEQPPLLQGAPDYTQTQFQRRQAEFEKLRATLNSMEIAGWAVSEQVDWHLVRAEMNGYDFNRRVLMPWARDPAFYNTIWTYRSDVPAHEGPTHHAVVELWQYEFPLSEAAEARLARELSVIPPLFAQAKKNLTGNARDLWITGIRDVRSDIDDLDNIESQLTESASEALRNAIAEARVAAVDLVAWLESQASEKTGPSGIGKENYTWYLQNVHLVPLSWEDEVRLLERELARAWSSLKLEEQRNQGLPPLVAVTNQEGYEITQSLEQRGLHVISHCEHLFLFDKPHDPSDRLSAPGFIPFLVRNRYQRRKSLIALLLKLQ